MNREDVGIPPKHWLALTMILTIFASSITAGTVGYLVGSLASKTSTPSSPIVGPDQSVCPPREARIAQTNNSLLVEGRCLVFSTLIYQNLTIVEKCYYCYLVFHALPKIVLNIQFLGNQSLIDAYGNIFLGQLAFFGYSNILRIQRGTILLGNNIFLSVKSQNPFVAVTWNQNVVETLA